MFVALGLLSACEKRHVFHGLRCQGGVKTVNGHEQGDGGECIEVFEDNTARLSTDYKNHYVLKKVDAERYDLLLDGKIVGKLTWKTGDRWMTVQMEGGREMSLRDDMPGPFI